MTAQSSATLRPTSFAVFVAMPAIWLEIVPTGNAEQIGGTISQAQRLGVARLVELVAAMLSIVNMRYVPSPVAFEHN